MVEECCGYDDEEEGPESIWERFHGWRWDHYLCWHRYVAFLRVRTPLAHFWKWRMGDGEHCFFCKLCRRYPIVQKVIPYSWDSAYDPR